MKQNLIPQRARDGALEIVLFVPQQMIGGTSPNLLLHNKSSKQLVRHCFVFHSNSVSLVFQKLFLVLIESNSDFVYI